MLYVADEGNTSDCSKVGHWAKKTSSEVSASLGQYSAGNEPNIGILKMTFANGLSDRGLAI